MVTKCLRFPECEDGDFVTEAATATCTLLAMLPQLEQADLSREDLLLPQALLLQHFSGGTLLRLDILLDVSQKELPEILAVVGQFHQLETLSIMICQQTENPQAERPILPIILPALRTMKYEVTCEGVLPWLHFLGQSRFPELRTLDLVASEYGRDKESQFLSALRPLLEQQPRLQRLQTNLTWSGTRVLLGQPMCIHELAIYIESSIQPDVPLPVITLLPAITTLKLHGIFLSEEVLILRAIVIGLAARAHGQLRCIRMSRYDWAAILAPPDLTLQSRARPDVVPELWASELQRSQCGMQLLWLAQDLRKLGVVLEDRGGKRVDEGMQNFGAEWLTADALSSQY
jgi:hypothetical protein